MCGFVCDPYIGSAIEDFACEPSSSWSGAMAALVQSLGLVTSSEEKEWPHNKSAHRSSDSLWKEYFRDPSQWWDNRISKVGPSYPDFKHKLTKESLWIDGRHNPSWVGE
eukprot:c24989_g17_i1 orf=63-389(+)